MSSRELACEQAGQGPGQCMQGASMPTPPVREHRLQQRNVEAVSTAPPPVLSCAALLILVQAISEAMTHAAIPVGGVCRLQRRSARAPRWTRPHSTCRQAACACAWGSRSSRRRCAACWPRARPLPAPALGSMGRGMRPKATSFRFPSDWPTQLRPCAPRRRTHCAS